MLEMNKVYTWDIIASTYPNMWAFITDVKRHNGEITSCRLLAISSKDDKVIYLQKYFNSNIKFECCRTTFNAPNIGVLA